MLKPLSSYKNIKTKRRKLQKKAIKFKEKRKKRFKNK